MDKAYPHSREYRTSETHSSSDFQNGCPPRTDTSQGNTQSISSPSQSPSSLSDPSANSDHSNTGAIIGGAVGGALAVFLLLLLTLLLIRLKRLRNQRERSDSAQLDTEGPLGNANGEQQLRGPNTRPLGNRDGEQHEPQSRNSYPRPRHPVPMTPSFNQSTRFGPRQPAELS
jgi:hypothetical protein